MKIDRSKLKKSSSDVSADCHDLIERLKNCPDLLAELKQIKTWNYGKSELYQWVDVLDKFDAILEEAAHAPADHSWHLNCDRPENRHLQELVRAVLTFTALLVEHSFSRHLYNSVEHLTSLLASSNLSTVLAVLNLVYVFSKRSNFLIKLSQGKRQELFQALTYLAESWGGKNNGFGLAECCRVGEGEGIPESATTLHFEFYSDKPVEERTTKKHPAQALTIVHIENVHKLSSECSVIMEDLVTKYHVPKEKQMLLFTHVRLAHCFSIPEQRLLCVQARLQALSVLVYSSAIYDIPSTLLYTGLVEELVEVLQVENPMLVEIKAASLRTLTSIIHLDRNPELVNIIEATGASSYHGFLPVLVRQCIQAMMDPQQEAVPHVLATALFSFLYHLASYGTGGEALVYCNMMESLLKVIKWHGEDENHTTFVTRAVRVVDLITNLDMAAFQTNGGLSIFLNRLEHEVNICRQEVPYVIRPTIRTSATGTISNPASPSQPFEAVDPEASTGAEGSSESTPQGPSPQEGPTAMDTDSPSTSSAAVMESFALEVQQDGSKPGRQCFPQRAALLKSMLNFLKKAIPDPAFADSIRHVMDGSLPRSLKHLISNAEYYGPSLFLLACEFVTVYVFQEPSLLSSLQDTGLTDVMLHALLIKDVPATKEVLGSLPNIFSALCLNARGLEAFVKCKPFDKLFKVLLSPAYLPAMRRRRSNEIMGDTALSLGSAMDELMRHQPSLKSDAMKAIIKLLEEICSLGRDKRYTCAKTPPKSKSTTASTPQTTGDDTSSDDDDDEEVVTEEIRNPTEVTVQKIELPQFTNSEEKKPIPLLDYIFNVMKFVEAILCTNATDDHCWEFVGQKGHEPLMEILRLPNLPIDFPSSQACQSVASVCKAILSLAREQGVLKQGLQLLKEVLQKLEPLNHPLQPPGGSILLKELLNSPNPPEAPLSAGATPLLHSVISAHSYVTMLFHVCRVGQGDVRTLSINQWGTELGQEVLAGLCQLYTSLVWESIVLLSLFTPGSIPDSCDLGKQDMKKLLELTAEMQEGKKSRDLGSSSGSGQGLTSSFGPGESPTTVMSSALSSMEMDDTQPPPPPLLGEDPSVRPKDPKTTMTLQTLQQLKQEVPALYAPSRLGRALSELFGLLVKLCVGSSMRQRVRPNAQANQTVPSEAARKTAKTLMELLMRSLQWKPPTMDALPKFRLTFYICAVSFASPMLFDDKKQPYHLMLQKFVSSGAHKVLFEAFDWALSPDNPFEKEGTTDLTEGTCEFIDAWLALIKKMVNPESILESPHSMPAKSTQAGFVPFQAVQFLINTHKAAFQSLMKLWTSGFLKNLGSRTSESVLSILCHILRGESVIAERLKQARAEDGSAGGTEGAAGSSGVLSGRSRLGGASSSFLASEILGGWGGSGGRQQRQEPSDEHIQQLMDMGFPRDHAIDALNHTTSLPQAAEWAISHQPRLTQDFGTGMSEEEEMMQAIAMSLGEALVPPAATKAEEEEKKRKEEADKKKKEEEDQKKLEASEKIPEEEPLSKEVLDGFVNNMLPGCLTLMDDVPDIVARVCDLLVIANERNGDKWRDDMLQTLIGQIAENALLLEQFALDDSSKPSGTEEAQNRLNSLPQSPRLATRIHLLCLLFEEMKMPCARMIESSGVLDVFVRLVHVSQQYLSTTKEATTSKWLAPLLLLLDLYERAVVSFRRKLDWVHTASHHWKWFDDSSGRWCPYSRGNNKTIDDAFWAGKSSIRFTAARRKYIVNFNRMVQVNEETTNRRPIMQALKTDETAKKDEDPSKISKKQKTDTGAAQAGTSSQTTSAEEKEQVAKQPEIVAVEGLGPDQITSLLRSCIGLIAIPVEPDALHAVLRLCLRFTRNHQHALMFSELGGPGLLLSLTQSSAFNGFSLLATLLLRHIFESKSVLAHTMEKLVTTVANKGVGCLTCNVALGSVGSRELHYALRMLGPPSCRDPEVYIKAAKSCLKIDVPVSKRDISHYTSANAMLLLKGVTPSETQPVQPLDEHAKRVLSNLLESLVVPVETTPAETKEVPKEPTKDKSLNKSDSAAELAGAGLREIGDELLCFYSAERNVQRTESTSTTTRLSTVGTSMVTDLLPDTSSVITMPSTSTAKAKKTPAVAPLAITPEAKSKPLITKSAVLRLLAELVKPYIGCAQFVAQYQFIVCSTPHAKEDGPALAFILDNLLPPIEKSVDKDCPAQAQLLLASLASCNHSPEAQATLVSEVKAALQRALSLPESKDKHARIQALTLLISVMIEACPSTTTTPPHTGTSTPAAGKAQTQTVNNITRLLLKKGFVTDLARITHSLDLSSPNMAATVNSALKPLDTLSRMVNQVPPGGKGTLKGSKMARNDILRGTSRTSRNRANESNPLRGSTNTSQLESEVNTELEEIVGELLEQQERDSNVLGETLIAAGPERLDSFQSSFLSQGGEDASQDEMVITMTEDGTDIEQTPGANDMEIIPNQGFVEQDGEIDSAADILSDREDEDEGQEDDDGDDDEDDDDDADDDDDDDSDMEAEEYDITEDLDYFRMGDTTTGDRDNDFFMPLDEVAVGDPGRQSRVPVLAGQFRSLLGDDVRPSTGITTGSGAGAFTARTSSTTHPLLIRNAMDDVPVTSQTPAPTRSIGRGTRQRLHVRPGGSNSQMVHIYHSGAHRPLSVSAVLRLLGMSSSSDVVQVSQTGNQTRVYVSNSNNELGGTSSLNDDILSLDDAMRETFRDGYLSSTDLSSNVAPVYKRWDEEASILDGESMFDCVEALKRPIIEVLEKRRDEELAERKEKLKKQTAEEAKKKVEEARKAAAKALLGRKKDGGAKAAEGGAKEEGGTKDEEEKMEISENGEKTSGEPSSGGTSEEASEVATPSEPEGAAAAAMVFPPVIPSAPVFTPGADLEVIRVPQIPSTLHPDHVEEHPGETSTPMASPVTAGAVVDKPEELPSSTTPMETSEQPESSTGGAFALSETTTTATGISQPVQLSVLSSSVGAAAVSTATILSSIATPTSTLPPGTQPLPTGTLPPPTGAQTLTTAHAPTGTTPPTTTQPPTSTPHPVSAILSTTGEVTLDSLLMGTASNIGAVSTTPLQTGERAMAESALTSGAPDPSNPAAPTTPASGDVSLPEGVDPSFLAALPDSIRREVLREHLGIQGSSSGAPKPPTTTTTTTTSSDTPTSSQVDPEFLAALPPHIQEEVLAEERAEQQRLQAAAQQQTSTAASSEPMDPAAFIQTLPRSLRQTVLSDMDHSMLALLPAELAAEAQALRLECARVIRRRQLLQERLIRETGRISGITGQGLNYYRLSNPRRTGASWANDFGHRPQSRLQGANAPGSQVQGRQLVDLEALTCLLVLLFLNEPKLNLVRLWRVLRNLSFHPPTRNWILASLLSILEKTKSCRDVSKVTDSPSKDMDSPSSGKNASVLPSWLSVSMDAALGCRASIFQVQRGNRKGADRQPGNVCIHPQAASMVCQNVLDTLYALADDFPQQFIPDPVAHAKASKQKDPTESDHALNPDSGAIQKSSGSSQRSDPDIWELLVKLDNTSLGRKGKSTSKSGSLSYSKEGREPSWDESPVARLLAMLSHPVVKKSTALTDKLLHLLTLVTATLPDKDKDANTQRQTSSGVRPGTTAPSAMAISVPSCQATESEANTPTGETPAPSAGETPAVSGGTPTAVGEIPTLMDTSSKESKDTKGEAEKGEKLAADAKTLVDESLLKLAVEVLTTHTCSGDGLEEATTLLMQLSRSHAPTREAVLRLLLDGAQDLGFTLGRDISQLKTEVTDFLKKQQQEQESMAEGDTDEPSSSTAGAMAPGVLVDRYNQNKKVVVSAPTTGAKRSGFELRLPSMVSFTGKTANQTVFLRILKVIIQLRNLAKVTPKSKLARQIGDYSEMSNAVAALARSASEMMAQRETERLANSTSQASTAASVTATPVGTTPSSTTPSISTPGDTTATGGSDTSGSLLVTPLVTPLSGEVPMEVDPVPPTPENTPPEGQGTPQPEAGVSQGQDGTARLLGAAEQLRVEATQLQAEAAELQVAAAHLTAGAAPLQVEAARLHVEAAQLHVEAAQLQVEAKKTEGDKENVHPSSEDDLERLSILLGLEDLWEMLSICLTMLSQTPDPHAVLVLQPAVEAFFLVHASEKTATKPTESVSSVLQPLHSTMSESTSQPSTSQPATPNISGVPSGFFSRDNSVASIVTPNMPPDTQKFLRFAEKHRSVLNQILRQSTVHLSEGPFAVLVNHVRILDFDVKRRYFRQELEHLDEGTRREDMAIHVRREHIFEDSYRELHRKTPDHWKDKFYVVFEGEEGQDAGGLLREWYLIISKEIFNPMYALFRTSPGDRVTYIPNPSSHCNPNHLSYFKFVGRIIAKAIYDNKLLECYFSRSFYKHILGKAVTYGDMESEDYAFYQGLVFLLEHHVSELGYELTFSTEIEEFGVTETRELKPDGANIAVTEENKMEYVHLVCQMKMTGAIRKQINSFLEGFYDIIPKRLISIFDEQELELLISGLPMVDVDDLKSNTEYHKYQSNSLQIQWFWRALRSFDQALRAKFIQFVTGTSKVPLQGFGSLEGMNGPQKFQIHRDDRSTDRLPTAHTCFNQLDLPAYETYDKLRQMLLLAIEECPEGFGLA